GRLAWLDLRNDAAVALEPFGKLIRISHERRVEIDQDEHRDPIGEEIKRPARAQRLRELGPDAWIRRIGKSGRDERQRHYPGGDQRRYGAGAVELEREVTLAAARARSKLDRLAPARLFHQRH